MKTRSLFLLFILCFSTFSIPSIQAQGSSSTTLDESLLLMYISDAILAGEPYVEEAYKTRGVALPGRDTSSQSDDVLAGMLNSAKSMRNDLDANCALLTKDLRTQGKKCEADAVQSYCDQRRQEINATIHALHQERGDKRKPLTKVWHFIKRSGRSIWQFIGPVGRNILRRVGPEALKIVTSGGSLTGDVVRQLVKQAARTMARERLRQVVVDGVTRMLFKQYEIARAAGLEVCDQAAVIEQIEGSDLTPTQEAEQPKAEVGEILTNEYKVQIIKGNAAAELVVPPEIYYANAAEYPSPPGGVVSYSSQAPAPFYAWLSVPNQGDWIQLEATRDVFGIGVQLWGDYEDGMVRVVVDGVPVWQGNTQFENCPKDERGFYLVNAEVCSGGFFYYVQVVGLEKGKHTIRAENAGGGYTTIYYFGLGEAGP